MLDINVYNLHLVVGMFGRPDSYHYMPNIMNNVDTSGILVLNYPTFKAVCIGAKDCRTCGIDDSGRQGMYYSGITSEYPDRL